MLPRDHYIDLADGRFNQTTAADLARLFHTVEQASTKNHIVVHFHGGLVSRSAGESSARGLMRYYEEGRAYPVFFLWRSDLWTVLTRNLDEIAKEPVFQRLVKRLVQLALGKLASPIGTRSAGLLQLESEDDLPDDLSELAQYAAEREPQSSSVKGVALSDRQVEQVEVALETDDVIQSESRAIAAFVVPPPEDAGARTRGAAIEVAPRQTLMSHSVLNELAEEQTQPGARAGLVTLVTLVKHGVAVLKRIVGRFSEGRDHRLYTTIVEEVLRELYLDGIGATAWTLMKKDTLDAFGGDPQAHGGTAFLEHLKDWWRPNRRITLVGHSTGAVYIGHFLDHADRSLDPAVKFDVVFLAPACSFEFMAARLEVFNRRVKRFRLFGLRDQLEHGYWEVPAVYPASLLYMVSGLFEDPIVDMPILGMERYFSGAEPYGSSDIQAVTRYLEGKCVWSIAQGVPGLGTSAREHGGFNDDVPTCESLREFLQSA